MRNPPLLLTGHTTLEITRREAEMIVRGRPSPSAEIIVEVVCNVQPVLKSTDTYLLPEADRSKATLKVYSKGGEIRIHFECSLGTISFRQKIGVCGFQHRLYVAYNFNNAF